MAGRLRAASTCVCDADAIAGPSGCWPCGADEVASGGADFCDTYPSHGRLIAGCSQATQDCRGRVEVL